MELNYYIRPRALWTLSKGGEEMEEMDARGETTPQMVMIRETNRGGGSMAFLENGGRMWVVEGD